MYLHWSAWDGQSLAILEAIAHDVVVVASDIPANREIVGPRQVCPDEPSAVALARSVLEDPALRADCSRSSAAARPAFGARRMVGGLARDVRANPRLASGARMQIATAAPAARKIGGPWT